GSGYAFPPIVTLTGAIATTPATVQAVLGTGTKAGQVVAINVINGGARYLSTPTVSIAQPPVQATGTARRRAGAPSLALYHGGAAYTTPPTVTLTGGVSPPPATAVAVLGSGAQAGQVVGIQLVTPGSYTVAPNVVIDPPGNAASALAINYAPGATTGTLTYTP